MSATLVFNLEDRSPFIRRFDISVGARLPDIVCQILQDNEPVDLTDGVVTFSMDSESGTLKVDDQSGTLVSATDGKFSYTWGAGDTDTAGVYYGQFKIVLTARDLYVPNDISQRLLITVTPAI